jgi:flagellar biosynthetic protein FliP
MPTAPPDLTLMPFLVVGLIALGAAALVWWQRRGGGTHRDDVIRLVATRALGGKRLLALVEVERERFLLGLTEDSVNCLGRLSSCAPDDASDRDIGAGPAHDGGERTWRAEGGHARSEEKSTTSRALSRPAAPHTSSREARAAAALAPPAPRAIGLFIPATVATLLLAAAPVHAALPQLSLEVGGNGDGLSTSIQLMLLFTLLSFAPAILIGVSAFVRIVIVLAFVRQAVGTQQMPPNQVVVALALFLTFFVMMPTLRQVNQDAVQPYLQDATPPLEALERGFQPLRAFMLRQTREKDLALFLGISQHARPDTAAEVPPEVVIPAFMISELKTAFQISFMVYIPFLVLDMVVASILTSMGMITLPPVLISLPFKLMIFVLVDGWNLLISSLVRSFQ